MPTPILVEYTNPVYDRYFADPFVFWTGEEWLAFGTGPVDPADQGMAFQVLRSRSLATWESIGAALIKPAGHEKGDFWAPEVAKVKGLYYMYYSVGQGDKGHHIRCAMSANPEGPYEDCRVMTSPDCPFAIDAHPYRHADGSWWLFYATDMLDGERPGTGIVVDRMTSMTSLEGKPRLVARATRDWQRYEANRSIYGGRHDWHTLEGPSVAFHEGRIYCFYSGGNWQNESYGVDYVSAQSPEGPWENTPGEAPRVLRTDPRLTLGPGHNSLILTPDGDASAIVYHGWDLERTARLMRIDPVVWTHDGPCCPGPTSGVRTMTIPRPS